MTEIARSSGTTADSAGVLTFLITDIRGYTRFTLEHGDAAAAELATRFAAVVNDVVSGHNGTVIELRGDEALAVFASARQALRAAVALQERLAAVGAAESLPLRAGIGLDAGEALPVMGGYRGAAINLAARLCSLAGAGEILVSETVPNLARKVEGLSYTHRGSVELKGFTEPVEVVAVTGSSGPEPQSEMAPALTTVRDTVQVTPEGDSRVVTQRFPIGGFLGALPDGKLVAREEERQRLVAAVEAVAAGEGRFVLISGEAGVGKTRLAQEATLLGRNHDFAVLTCRCQEAYGAVPLYPFREALARAYDIASTQIRAVIPERWPYLARLLPDLSIPHPAPADNTHEEQQRLFWAITSFLQAMSAVHPVALLLDDLHWADTSTLDLLQHLARQTRVSPVLLLGTYRETDIGHLHPLRRLTLSLERDRLLHQIPVRRMNRDATTALMVAAVGADDLPADVADLVYQRTEGNPFFTQEVLKTLVERGELYREADRWVSRPGVEIDVPETVRATIDLRLATLSEEAQEMLFAASVLGQVFLFDDLLAVLGRPEADVERGVDEAVGVGLLRPGDGDEYSFNHALTRQALYSELSPRRKRRLHLAAGTALEGLPLRVREQRATELAMHFLEGGDAERGLPYAIQAGDAAEAVFAHADAATQYGTALELAQQIGDEAQEARVREKLGGLLTATIRYSAALAMLEDAARLYRARGDWESEGRVVAQLGRVHVVNGTVEDGITRLAAFRPALEERGPSRALANLRSSLAHLLYALGRYDEALQAASEAASTAETVGDPAVRAEAEARRGATLAMLGRWTEAHALLQEAGASAQETRDVFTLCRVRQALGGIALLQGDLAACRDSLQDALRLAAHMGNRRQIAVATFGLSLHALVAGDMSESSLQAERALTVMHSLEGSWATACQIPGLDPLALPEEDWEGAGQYLQECLALASRGTAWPELRRVSALLGEGRGMEAADRLRALADAGLDAWQRAALAPLDAWARFETGDVERAERLVVRGVEEAERVHLRLPLITWRRLEGLLVDRLGRQDDAATSFAEADRLARDCGYPRALMHVLLDWGRMDARRGEEAAARERLEESLSLARRLEASKDVVRAERSLARLAG